MRNNLKRGFTLIELLVVIAIIGILASIVLISLSSARAKGRDAVRVGALREMAKAIAFADSTSAVSFTGCTGGISAGSSPNANIAACTLPAELANYQDPSAPVPAGTGTGICRNSATKACQYSVHQLDGSSGTPTTRDYEICTYLEGGLGNIPQGLARIDSTSLGTVVAGCN